MNKNLLHYLLLGGEAATLLLPPGLAQIAQAFLAAGQKVSEGIDEHAELNNIPPEQLTAELMARLEAEIPAARQFAAESRARILADGK